MKSIAFTVAFTFLVTNLGVSPNAFAAGGVPFAPEVTLPYQAMLDQNLRMAIPRDLGKIEDLHFGKGPAVFHIQTAHGHYEAQQQIRQILHHLNKNYGVKIVLVEGSAFKLNPEILNFFPDDIKLTLKVNDALTKAALVKGPELFLLDEIQDGGRLRADGDKQSAPSSILHPSSVVVPQAFGIENAEAYRANRESFVSVLNEKEKTKQFLADMDMQIERLASQHLNKDLRDFLKRLEAFEKNQIPFDTWLAYIRGETQKCLGIDLASPAHQIEWPMLVRVFKTQELSAKLDRQKFPKERDEFLKALRRFLPSKTTAKADLLSTMDHGLSTYTQVESLLKSETQSQQLPDPETSLLFEDMVKQLPPDFNYDRFPNVRYFIGTLLLQSELKADRLMEEVQKLSGVIALKLTRNKDEKKLVVLLADHRLLKKLFALELTPADYESIGKRMTEGGGSLKPSSIIDHFKDAIRHPSSSIQRVKTVKFNHVQDLDQLFDGAMKFYKGVKERDHAMEEMVEKRLAETGADRVAVITGGFHSQPFKDYFSGKGYTYALISPKLIGADEEGHEAYINNMLRMQDSGGRKADGVKTGSSPSAIHYPSSSTIEDLFLSDPYVSPALAQAVFLAGRSVLPDSKHIKDYAAHLKAAAGIALAGYEADTVFVSATQSARKRSEARQADVENIAEEMPDATLVERIAEEILDAVYKVDRNFIWGAQNRPVPVSVVNVLAKYALREGVTPAMWLTIQEIVESDLNEAGKMKAAQNISTILNRAFAIDVKHEKTKGMRSEALTPGQEVRSEVRNKLSSDSAGVSKGTAAMDQIIEQGEVIATGLPEVRRYLSRTSGETALRLFLNGQLIGQVSHETKMEKGPDLFSRESEVPKDVDLYWQLDKYLKKNGLKGSFPGMKLTRGNGGFEADHYYVDYYLTDSTISVTAKARAEVRATEEEIARILSEKGLTFDYLRTSVSNQTMFPEVGLRRVKNHSTRELSFKDAVAVPGTDVKFSRISTELLSDEKGGTISIQARLYAGAMQGEASLLEFRIGDANDVQFARSDLSVPTITAMVQTLKTELDQRNKAVQVQRKQPEAPATKHFWSSWFGSKTRGLLLVLSMMGGLTSLSAQTLQGISGSQDVLQESSKAQDKKIDELIRNLKAKDSYTRFFAGYDLVGIGLPAVPALIETLKDPDEVVRAFVVGVLGKIKHKEVLPALIGALGDRENVVRAAAADALRNVGDKQAIPALIKALSDKEYIVRYLAKEALVKIGQDAVPALIKALGERDENARGFAAKALDKIGWKPSNSTEEDAYNAAQRVPQLPAYIKQYFTPVDLILVGAIATALGAVFGPDLGPALTAVKDFFLERDFIVSGMMAVAIGIAAQEIRNAYFPAKKKTEKVGKEGAPVKSGESKENTSGKLLSVDPFLVVVGLVVALGTGVVASFALVHMLFPIRRHIFWINREEHRDALVKIGAPAVPAIIKALKDTWADTRRSAALVLGKIGPVTPEVVPALWGALEDKRLDVRAAAAEALGKIGPVTPEVVPALIKVLLEDKDSYVRSKTAEALEKTGALTPELKTKRYLLDLGEKISAHVRLSAAEALGDASPLTPGVVPALIRAMNDEWQPVRIAAAKSLKKIRDSSRSEMRNEEEIKMSRAVGAQMALNHPLEKVAVRELDGKDEKLDTESVVLGLAFGMIQYDYRKGDIPRMSLFRFAEGKTSADVEKTAFLWKDLESAWKVLARQHILAEKSFPARFKGESYFLEMRTAQNLFDEARRQLLDYADLQEARPKFDAFRSTIFKTERNIDALLFNDLMTNGPALAGVFACIVSALETGRAIKASDLAGGMQALAAKLEILSQRFDWVMSERLKQVITKYDAFLSAEGSPVRSEARDLDQILQEEFAEKIWGKISAKRRGDLKNFREIPQTALDEVRTVIAEFQKMLTMSGKIPPLQEEILDALLDSNVLHPYKIANQLPPTLVFRGSIFRDYSGPKPYRIAVTIGDDVVATNVTHTVDADFTQFGDWKDSRRFTHPLSTGFNLEKFMVGKGGSRYYQEGVGELKEISIAEKYFGVDRMTEEGKRLKTKQLLPENADLSRGMNAKSPPGDVPWWGGKSLVLVRKGADKKKAFERWVASSITAGFLGQRYLAGPDMGTADMMSVIQNMADRVHGDLGMPLARVTTSIIGEDASFRHQDWTVTSITGMEAFLEVIRNVGLMRQFGFDSSGPIDIVIQGFGDVGAGYSRYLRRQYPELFEKGRIRIVGISNIGGGIYDPEGLNVGELLRLNDADPNIDLFASYGKGEKDEAVLRKSLRKVDRGDDIYFVRQLFPDMPHADEPIVGFPAANPGVIKSKADIDRLVAAKVKILIACANNFLKEDAGLDVLLENAGILFFDAPFVSSGGINTSGEEIYHIYTEGIEAVRKMKNADPDYYRIHVQDGITNLIISLTRRLVSEYERSNRRQSVTQIHEDLARKIRERKAVLLGDPTSGLMQRVNNELNRVWEARRVAFEKDPALWDEVALTIILTISTELAREDVMYDDERVLQMMHDLGNGDDLARRIAIYELGRKRHYGVEPRLVEILKDEKQGLLIRSATAEALGHLNFTNALSDLTAVRDLATLRSSEAGADEGWKHLRVQAQWSINKMSSKALESIEGSSNARSEARKTDGVPTGDFEAQLANYLKQPITLAAFKDYLLNEQVSKTLNQVLAEEGEVAYALSRPHGKKIYALLKNDSIEIHMGAGFGAFNEMAAFKQDMPGYDEVRKILGEDWTTSSKSRSEARTSVKEISVQLQGIVEGNGMENLDASTRHAYGEWAALGLRAAEKGRDSRWKQWAVKLLNRIKKENSSSSRKTEGLASELPGAGESHRGQGASEAKAWVSRMQKGREEHAASVGARNAFENQFFDGVTGRSEAREAEPVLGALAQGTYRLTVPYSSEPVVLDPDGKSPGKAEWLEYQFGAEFSEVRELGKRITGGNFSVGWISVAVRRTVPGEFRPIALTLFEINNGKAVQRLVKLTGNDEEVFRYQELRNNQFQAAAEAEPQSFVRVIPILKKGQVTAFEFTPQTKDQEIEFQKAMKDLQPPKGWGLFRDKVLPAVNRAAAARVLGRLKDPRAVPALTLALSDKEEIVRNAADGALKSIEGSSNARSEARKTDGVPTGDFEAQLANYLKQPITLAAFKDYLLNEQVSKTLNQVLAEEGEVAYALSRPHGKKIYALLKNDSIEIHMGAGFGAFNEMAAFKQDMPGYDEVRKILGEDWTTSSKSRSEAGVGEKDVVFAARGGIDAQVRAAITPERIGKMDISRWLGFPLGVSSVLRSWEKFSALYPEFFKSDITSDRIDPAYIQKVIESVRAFQKVEKKRGKTRWGIVTLLGTVAYYAIFLRVPNNPVLFLTLCLALSTGTLIVFGIHTLTFPHDESEVLVKTLEDLRQAQESERIMGMMLKGMPWRELQTVRGLYYETRRAETAEGAKAGEDQIKVVRQAYEQLRETRQELPVADELVDFIDQNGGISLMDAKIREYQEPQRRSESRAATLAVQLGRKWDEIRSDGLFVFDMQKTLVERKGIVTDGMRDLLIWVLSEGVPMVVISANSREEVWQQLMEPLLKGLRTQKKLPAAENILVYANSGTSKYWVDRKGERHLDVDFSKQFLIGHRIETAVREGLKALAKKGFFISTKEFSAFREIYEKDRIKDGLATRFLFPWTEKNLSRNSYKPSIVVRLKDKKVVQAPYIVRRGILEEKPSSRGTALAIRQFLPGQREKVWHALEGLLPLRLGALASHFVLRGGGLSTVDFSNEKANKAFAFRDAVHYFQEKGRVVDLRDVVYHGDEVWRDVGKTAEKNRGNDMIMLDGDFGGDPAYKQFRVAAFNPEPPTGLSLADRARTTYVGGEQRGVELYLGLLKKWVEDHGSEVSSQKSKSRAEVRGFVALAETALKNNWVSEEALKNIRSWSGPEYARVHGRLDEEFKLAGTDPQAWSKINDEWYTKVVVGTAGMRGTLGLGTNRISEYTLGSLMMAHALSVNDPAFTKIIEKTYPEFREKGLHRAVVIAGDSRHGSYDTKTKKPGLQIKLEALINVALGIKAYVFKSPTSTPQLAWAVHELNVEPTDLIVSGSENTASHNPLTDNGNKPYKIDGSQATGVFSDLMAKYLPKAGVAELNALTYDGMNVLENVDAAFERALSQGDIRWVGGTDDDSYKDDAYHADELFVQRELQEAIYTVNGIFDNTSLDLKNSKIVISPLFGVSRHILKKIAKARGLRDDQIFWVEDEPNSDFPGVEGGKPNPEDPKARLVALRKAVEVNADLVLWTDPDADRPAVSAKKDPKKKAASIADYASFNGNQQLAILMDYLIREMKIIAAEEPLANVATRTHLAEKAAFLLANIWNVFAAFSLVSADLPKIIARENGLKVVETLVGFKYVGDQIEARSRVIQELAGITESEWQRLSNKRKVELAIKHSEAFLFGGEESLGALSSDGPHDKDALAAVMWFVEIMGRLRKEGKTLGDRLNEIYETYGYFSERFPMLEKIRKYAGVDFSEAEAKQIIDAEEDSSIMNFFKNTPPKTIAGKKVIAVLDYYTQVAKDTDGKVLFDANSHSALITAETPGIPKSFRKALGKIGVYSFRHDPVRGSKASAEKLPKEKFVRFIFEGGSIITPRPSGTESKIKFYVLGRGRLEEKEAVDAWVVAAVKELDAIADAIAKERFPEKFLSEARSITVDDKSAVEVRNSEQASVKTKAQPFDEYMLFGPHALTSNVRTSIEVSKFLIALQEKALLGKSPSEVRVSGAEIRKPAKMTAAEKKAWQEAYDPSAFGPKAITSDIQTSAKVNQALANVASEKFRSEARVAVLPKKLGQHVIPPDDKDKDFNFQTFMGAETRILAREFYFGIVPYRVYDGLVRGSYGKVSKKNVAALVRLAKSIFGAPVYANSAEAAAAVNDTLSLTAKPVDLDKALVSKVRAFFGETITKSSDAFILGPKLAFDGALALMRPFFGDAPVVVLVRNAEDRTAIAKFNAQLALASRTEIFMADTVEEAQDILNRELAKLGKAGLVSLKVKALVDASEPIAIALKEKIRDTMVTTSQAFQNFLGNAGISRLVADFRAQFAVSKAA